MSGSISTPVLYDLTNLQAPASGVTHAINLTVKCSNASPVTNFSPANYVNSFGAFNAQSMRVDNSANQIGFTVTESIFGWTQYIAAGTVTTFNFPAIKSPEFTFSSDAGLISVPIQFFDFPSFSFINSNPNNAAATPIGNPSGTALPVTITGGTITGAAVYNDASVTATGASQVLAAANASRRYILIGAPATSPIWVNFAGGTAGAGLTGCVQISAGGFYESNLIVPSNAVNVFCASAGLNIPCLEG